MLRDVATGPAWWQGPPKYTKWVLFLTLLAGSGMAKDPPPTQRIFRCEVGGQLVFSDRPCEAAPSVEVSLSAVNTYHDEGVSAGSGKVAKRSLAKEKAAQRPEGIAAAQLRSIQHCKRLTAQLDEIRSKLRSGYTIEQGEKLRARERELDRRRREGRCR